MCIEDRKSTKADPKKYAEVLAASEQWGEIKRWREYDWRLVRKVPVAELEHSTIEEYEADADTDEYRDLERVSEIIALLRAGGKLWPVVLGMDCMILDGYHRLVAADELEIEVIDVIYPTSRRT